MLFSDIKTLILSDLARLLISFALLLQVQTRVPKCGPVTRVGPRQT